MDSQGSHPPAFLSTHPTPGKRADTLGKQAIKLMPVYQGALNAGHTPHCKL
jgi:predicted Zn-dependent protease